MNQYTHSTALITGAALRVGRAIATHLHTQGMNVLIHCHQSVESANELAASLNHIRPNSAAVYSANLLDETKLPLLIEQCLQQFGRLDLLVNNASSFYPTPLGEITEEVWQDLMGSNVKAPLLLSQAAAPFLKASKGAIIGIVDIHAQFPLKNHVVYNLAKAAHAQLIRVLAQDLAPDIRVNGVSPGANIWPESEHVFDTLQKQAIISRIPLAQIGVPEDIATAVWALYQQPYVTGQILAVDGGLSVVP
ncbi:pteridine reductase [Neisseria sp. Ec49-e6-T10]|uniref:pteridine reductase n=1 Tax=Neisseria sp. Ec49-e6-T10 TaxID=3140744 RepID=UPI003EBD6401